MSKITTTHEIKQMQLTKIIPADNNPREITPEARAGLQASLERFGLLDVLVVNKRTGRLVKGHQRLELLLVSGVKRAPVLLVDFDEITEKAANVSLNNQDLAGRFTDAVLPLIEELKAQMQGDALSLRIDELRNQIAAAEPIGPADGLTDPDAIPEPPAKPITRPGDLWLLGEHRVLCGDSTKEADVARLMDGEKAGLLFTSPPYGQQRDYTEASKEHTADWDKLMCGVFANIPMADDGQVLVNLGLIHRDNEWIPYWENWIQWMRQQGWRRFGWYVWDQGSGLPGHWAGRLAPSFEFIFHFNQQSISPKKIIPTKLESQKHPSTSMGFNPNKQGGSRPATSVDKLGQPFKIPDSVIRINRSSTMGSQHPATFPCPFACFILQTYSCEKFGIFDPFLGSGTTLIAAEQLGRRCFGMEIEPRYCDVIVKRWEEFTGQKAKRIAPDAVIPKR
ncbi:MAG: DNA modification methylase [Acidobacteriota bacterium]